ncbi:pyridoxal 5'-phosphate synthase [Lentzea sp. NPDC004789]
MAVNVQYKSIGPEFTRPPADPVALLRDWFAQAVAHGVREPGATALATVAADGTPSSRMIQISRITDRGLLFATHAGSRKGREIGQTGRCSGVLYWRETNQQVTFGGRAEPADEAVAEELWAPRPVSSNAMSIATRQSHPLVREEELLEQAVLLATAGGPLVRPSTWLAYELVLTEVEFWQSSPDALYRRLHYRHTGAGWTAQRLQP